MNTGRITHCYQGRNNITLSVIVASYNSSETIEKCLQSLEDQKNREDFEVIVVDSSEDGTPEIVENQFPKVRLYTFSERKFPGDARNFGVSKAKGQIFAFTDADCIVDNTWVNEIIKAHQTPYPAIGGAIANGNPESYPGWGYYFCEFSQWMSQSQECRMVEIPTCCLSIKLWAFDKYGPFLEGVYCSDTAFHWKLGKDGHKPLFVPSIKVSHINIQSLIKFLKKEVMHGRFFAAVRVSEQKFSMLQRITYVMISPLLPFLLFYHTAKDVLKKEVYLKQFILSSPLVLLGLTAWSFGEFLGYLSKPGE